MMKMKCKKNRALFFESNRYPAYQRHKSMYILNCFKLKKIVIFRSSHYRYANHSSANALTPFPLAWDLSSGFSCRLRIEKAASR